MSNLGKHWKIKDTSKMGHTSWLKGTKGLVKANSGSFKKGERRSKTTEFKKGGIPWSKDRKISSISEKMKGNKNPLGCKRTEKQKEQIRIRNSGKNCNFYIDGRSMNLEKMELIAGRKKPNTCELCGRTGRICFDHDHKTGNFRGWICQKCNSALGLVEDNKETLNLMIKYLDIK